MDSDKFQIDAAMLQDKQSCARLHVLGNDWRFARYRPKSLMDTLMRRGILQLSNGLPVPQVVAEARASFLEKAANPGLDLIGKDPFQSSKGWISLLECLLYGLSKTSIPRLHDPLPAKLTGSIDWRFLSWADDSGQLHRWMTTAEFDNDVMFREMHSWRTFGDICMARVPMQLHIITIGRQQELGHFASAWNRTWRHPVARLNIGWKFIKPEDTAWKALYRTDLRDVSAEEWVEMAWKQNALQPLLQDFLMDEPPEHVRLDTLRQIAEEANHARALLNQDWTQLPMSRGECDKWNSPCAYQPACYSAEPYDFAASGLYVRRKQPKGELAWHQRTS